MTVRRLLHRCKVLSLLLIVILGLQRFAFASADSSGGEQHDAGAWCDERIRELENQFNSRLSNEVQSTQIRADESCNHRLAEAAGNNNCSSCQQETAILLARLTETQSLLDTCNTNNDRTSALESTIQELQTRIANEIERSNNCGLQLEEKAQMLQTQAAQIQELHAAVHENENLEACMNHSMTMQQQLDPVQENHVKEMDIRVATALETTRLEMQQEHARKLKMVQDRYNILSDENTQMMDSLRIVKVQLQKTKNELFTIRQELFHSNEQLRFIKNQSWYQILLPTVVVEWLEQSISIVMEKIQLTWKMMISSPILLQTQARIMTYLKKAGIPAAWQNFLIHARPLAGMIYDIATTLLHELMTLLQNMRQEFPVYWKEFVQFLSQHWKEFVKVASPKLEQTWKMIQTTSIRIWEQIREMLQPLVDKIPWEKLEPHLELIQRLWNDFMKDTESIRAQFSVYATHAVTIMSQVAETMHHLAIDVFHQVVRTLHLLLKMYEAPSHMVDWMENLHLQSETIIWYIEATLGTILAMVMTIKILGIGGNRRGVKGVKTEGNVQNGTSHKKLQRIEKRQTEKLAKTKQVQFSGR